MNESLVAAEVNCTSQGTPSLACITECTLMPPFFFPILGCLPTPLKIALENSVIVVESMILSRFIHSSVPLRRLSEEICTFTHGYSWIVWRHPNNHIGLTPANGISPNFFIAQKCLADSNNTFPSTTFKYTNFLSINLLSIKFRQHGYSEFSRHIPLLPRSGKTDFLDDSVSSGTVVID